MYSLTKRQAVMQLGVVLLAAVAILFACNGNNASGSGYFRAIRYGHV